MLQNLDFKLIGIIGLYAFLGLMGLILLLSFIIRPKKEKVYKAECGSCTHNKNRVIEPGEITEVEVNRSNCTIIKEIYSLIVVCSPDTLHLNKDWILKFRSNIKEKIELAPKSCEGAILFQKLIDTKDPEALHLKKQWMEDFLLQAEIILKTNCKECTLYIKEKA